MTFDVTSNSPFVSQENTRDLEGEFSNLSEVTYCFFPGAPSFIASEYCICFCSRNHWLRFHVNYSLKELSHTFE